MKETRFRTNDPGSMLDMYLAEDVRRSWTEDYTDDNTGEVVSVKRSELVMERGTLLDADALSRLSFYLQSGDIMDVEVSNIQRTAKPYEGGFTHVWEVKATVNGKKISLLLYARAVVGALDIASEYPQRNYKGVFEFTSVKGFGNAYFIEINIPAPTNEKSKDCGAKVFYQIDASIRWNYDEYSDSWTFIVLAQNVNEAQGLIVDFVRDHAKTVKERLERTENRDRDTEYYKRMCGGFEVILMAATELSCSAIVPRELTKEYYESLKEEAAE